MVRRVEDVVVGAGDWFLCMQGLADDMPGSLAGFRFNLIGRIDHLSGRVSTHDVGVASATQEPIFVPRPGSVDEGDGYVLALVNRYAEMRSDLLVLTADELSGYRRPQAREPGDATASLIPRR